MGDAGGGQPSCAVRVLVGAVYILVVELGVFRLSLDDSCAEVYLEGFTGGKKKRALTSRGMSILKCAVPDIQYIAQHGS